MATRRGAPPNKGVPHGYTHAGCCDLADPSGQADQHQDQHPLWLEAVVTPRWPEPLVGSGLVTALRHGLSLGYRGDVAL